MNCWELINIIPLNKGGFDMPMKNPPHLGKVVRTSCLEPLGLNVTEGAKILGVSRQALSNLVNGRAPMSADMAIRLAKAFGSTTETWIQLQAAYDVAQAQAREDEIEVERYEPQPVSNVCMSRRPSAIKST